MFTDADIQQSQLKAMTKYIKELEFNHLVMGAKEFPASRAGIQRAYLHKWDSQHSKSHVAQQRSRLKNIRNHERDCRLLDMLGRENF